MITERVKSKIESTILGIVKNNKIPIGGEGETKIINEIWEMYKNGELDDIIVTEWEDVLEHVRKIIRTLKETTLKVQL